MSYTILLATDGSMPSLVATKKAVDHAREKSGGIVIVHVNEQAPLVRIEKIAEDLALDRRCSVDFVSFALDYAMRSNIPARVLSRDGPVAGEIVRAAEETAADLIVMGRTDPKGIDGVMRGNVAEAVLKMAPCSVWTIKPSKAELEEIVRIVRERAKPKVQGVAANGPEGIATMAKAMLVLYVAGYTAFTLGGTYFRGIMSEKLLGMNVAIVFGMVIIAAAIVIALVYNRMAGAAERARGA